VPEFTSDFKIDTSSSFRGQSLAFVQLTLLQYIVYFYLANHFILIDIIPASLLGYMLNVEFVVEVDEKQSCKDARLKY
jgi:hypothetical protein